MNLDTVIDTAIGVLVLIAAISAAASTINEIFSAAFARRGENLRKTVRHIFTGGSKSAEPRAFLGEFLASGTIKALFPPSKGRWPSYIDKNDFANALIGVLSADGAPATVATVVSGVNAKNLGTDCPIGTAVKHIAKNYDDLSEFREELARWFESAVERGGGAYARNSQYVLFGIGFLLAAVLYADPTRVAYQLWNDDALRQRTVEAAAPFLNQYAPPIPNGAGETAASDAAGNAPDGSAAQPADTAVDASDSANVGEATEQDATAAAGAETGATDTADAASTTVQASPAPSAESTTTDESTEPDTPPAGTTVSSGGDEVLAMVSKAGALRALIESAFPVGWTGVEQEAFAPMQVKCAALGISDGKQCLEALTAFGENKTVVPVTCVAPQCDIAHFAALHDEWDASSVFDASWYFHSFLRGLFGFIILGLAASVGAKVWFDILRKAVNLRMAGKKPDEASQSA